MSLQIDLSNILSILSLCGTIYTFFFYQRKMNRQQVLINNMTINKANKEEKEELQANISAVRDKETKSLVVSNIGKGTAKNIRINYNSLNKENGFFVADMNKLPYPILNSGDSFKIHLEVCAQICKLPVITLIWDDAFENDREKEQAIDLY